MGINLAMNLVGCRYQATKDFLKGPCVFSGMPSGWLKHVGIKLVQQLMSTTSMETAQQQVDLLRTIIICECQDFGFVIKSEQTTKLGAERP